MHALARLQEIRIRQTVVENGIFLHADLGLHALGNPGKRDVGHIKGTLHLAQEQLRADIHILAGMQIDSCTVGLLLSCVLIHTLG